MAKEKKSGVAQAVNSKPNKKRFPSLLSKVKGSGSGAARLISFHKRTNVKKPEIPPPVSSVVADRREDKISDLTTPQEPRTAAPPVQQIDPSFQSVGSSLTLSAALNRSQSSTIHTEATENLTQNQLLQPLGTRIMPKTPKTSNETKQLELNSGIRLKAPSPVSLDKYEVQVSGRQPSEHVSQPLRSSTSQPDPPQPNLYSDDDFMDDPSLKDEAPIGSTSKHKANKIPFSKVKALLMQVQQREPPEETSEPDAKIVAGIPVVSASGSLVGPPVIEAAYSYRESPSKASSGRAGSPEPSKRSRHPDLLSTGSPSSANLAPKKSVDPDSVKLASPSPEAKHSRKSLSPDLSVGFGNTGSQHIQRGIDPSTSPINERIPVDAPEEEDDVFKQWSPATTHDEHDLKHIPPRVVVGIPVNDSEYLDSSIKAQNIALGQDVETGPFKFNPFNSEPNKERDRYIYQTKASSGFKAAPNRKSYNPFDSSASEASMPKSDGRNPFDSSDDEEEDVFANIVSSTRKEDLRDGYKSEEEGIPVPNYKFMPSPTEARKKSRKVVSPKALSDRINSDKEVSKTPLKHDSKKNKKQPGRVKVLVDRFSGPKVNLPVTVDMTGTSQISDLDQSLRHFPAQLVEEKIGAADISHLDATAGQNTRGTKNSMIDDKEESVLQVVQDRSTALADSSMSLDDASKQSRKNMFSSDSPLTKMLVGRLVNERRGDGVDSAYRKQKLTKTTNEYVSVISKNCADDPAVLDHAPSEIYRMAMETPRIANGINVASDASGLKLGGVSIAAASTDQHSKDVSVSDSSLNVHVKNKATAQKLGDEKDAADVYIDKLQQFSPKSQRERTDQSPKDDKSNASCESNPKLNHVFEKLRNSRASSKNSLGSTAKSDTSTLLSQLEEFGTNVKKAARESILKAEKEGAGVPPWTQELIDLTGINSFDDLEDEEAVWLFEIGSNEHNIDAPQTPKSDLESVMRFAAKRLGLAVEDNIGTESVLSNIETLSAVAESLAANSNHLVARTADGSSQETTAKSPARSPASKAGSGENNGRSFLATHNGHDHYYPDLSASKSSFDEKSQDKYLVSKSEEDNYADGEYDAKKHARTYQNRQPHDDSDVSSTDNLSMIMSKIQRDCNKLEQRRAQLKIETESRAEHWAEETASQQGANSTRKDFLEVLFESTGAFFCGQGAESYVEDNNTSKDYTRKVKARSRQRKGRSEKASSSPVHKTETSLRPKTSLKMHGSEESVEAVHETVEIIASEKIMSGLSSEQDHEDLFLEMEPSPVAMSDCDSLRELSKVRVPLDPEEIASNRPSSAEEGIEDAGETTGSVAGSFDKNADSDQSVAVSSVPLDEDDDQKKVDSFQPPNEPNTKGGPKPEDFISQGANSDPSPGSSTASSESSDVSNVVKPVPHYPSQQKSQDTLDIVFESTASRDTTRTGNLQLPLLSNETDNDQSEKSGENNRDGSHETPSENPLNVDELRRRSLLLQPLGFFVPEMSNIKQKDYLPPNLSETLVASKGPLESKEETRPKLEIERSKKNSGAQEILAANTVDSCAETTIQLLSNTYNGDGKNPETAIVLDEAEEFSELQHSSLIQESIQMQIKPAISVPYSSADGLKSGTPDDDINFAISPSTASSPIKFPHFDESGETESQVEGSAVAASKSVHGEMATNGRIEVVPGEIAVQKRPKNYHEIAGTSEGDKNGRDDSSGSIDLIPKSFLMALGLGEESSSAISSSENELALSKDAQAALDGDEFSSGDESASLLLALTRSETETNVSGSPINHSRNSLDDHAGAQGIKVCSNSPTYSERRSRRARLERAKLAAKKARTPNHKVSRKSFEFESKPERSPGVDSKQRSARSQIQSVPGHLELHEEMEDTQWTQPPEMTMTTSLSRGSSFDQGDFSGKPHFSSHILESEHHEYEDPIDAEALYAEHYPIEVVTDGEIIDVTGLSEQVDVVERSRDGFDNQAVQTQPEVTTKPQHFGDSRQNTPKKKQVVGEVLASSSSESSHAPLLRKVVDRMKRKNEEHEILANSSSDSSEIDELFRRYDRIVSDMVVLDEERLAKAQAKQIANIVEAADSAVGAKRAKNQSTDPNKRDRRKSTGGTKPTANDKVLNVRKYPTIKRAASSGSLKLRYNDSEASDEASNPSQKARELREQIEEALQASAAIRDSQKALTVELTSFQSRIQQRRALSPEHSPVSRSAPNSPFSHRKSYYHRNCASYGMEEVDDQIPIQRSQLTRPTIEVPKTVVSNGRSLSKDISSMNSFDSSHQEFQYSDDEAAEEIQSQRVESILSGLRKADSVANIQPRGFRKKVTSARRRNSNTF